MREEKKKKRGALTGLLLRLIVLCALLCVAWNVWQDRGTYNTGILHELGETARALKEFKSTRDEASSGGAEAFGDAAGAASQADLSDYRNLALFGVDSREGALKDYTRTDTIIVMSIHKSTGDVRLLSVYRDTYLNTGGDTYTKCNAAYAYGGPTRAVAMLNANLDLNIEDFVTVGFGGLVSIIDDIGGITVTVEENEVDHLNNYQSTMAQELGMAYTPVAGPGEQVLNGLQATAYCRIRYTSGDDFRRAERQREVLMQVLQGIKHASPTQVLHVAKDTFDWTYTSLGLTDLGELMLGFAGYSMKESGGFPFAGMFATGRMYDNGDCVVPVTLESNVKTLHGFLFGDADYQVSDTVRAYSEKISADAAANGR